ncbi:MAG TPA: 50S ribosomal protein L33 [Candidatus Kaiserbacteria bacterium]|nr:50S ribosomal protein L33 [Candidatus Kaiserbacteria bacterium]
MSQSHLIKLRSTKSEYVYHTRKNKKKVERKIEYKKYDPTTRKHEIFKETKK